MRALIIDQKARDEIARVVSYAMDHIVHVEDGMTPAGDNKNFVCHIERGFRCVFSFEFQKIGICRHLSVSVTGEKKWPNVEAVQLLMGEFGFVGKLKDCKLWMEDEVEAVNVLELADAGTAFEIGGRRATASDT